MGFPSPATDYVEQRLTVNSICNVGPSTLLLERSGGYVVLDISLKPKQGSQLLIRHGGGTELATLRGRSLITEDGEAIEGEALGRCYCHRRRRSLYAMFVLIILLFNWGIYGADFISQ